MNAKQPVAASRSEQPDDLAAKRWLRSNFVARRPDETEYHAQPTGNPGNVGLFQCSDLASMITGAQYVVGGAATEAIQS